MGRELGHTFGYHTNRLPRAPRRLDRFFYTGSLETVALDNGDDRSFKVGRLGLNLTTRVDALKVTAQFLISDGRGAVPRSGVRYLPVDSLPSELAKYKLDKIEKTERVRHHVWVSDHFGITIGIKII
jgi:hypothetical protein